MNSGDKRAPNFLQSVAFSYVDLFLLNKLFCELPSNLIEATFQIVVPNFIENDHFSKSELDNLTSSSHKRFQGLSNHSSRDDFI